jgi:hypothetical protein
MLHLSVGQQELKNQLTACQRIHWAISRATSKSLAVLARTISHVTGEADISGNQSFARGGQLIRSLLSSHSLLLCTRKAEDGRWCSSSSEDSSNVLVVAIHSAKFTGGALIHCVLFSSRSEKCRTPELHIGLDKIQQVSTC